LIWNMMWRICNPKWAYPIFNLKLKRERVS